MEGKTLIRRLAVAAASLSLIGVGAVVTAAPSSAATATANISAGSLQFVTTPPNVTFSATLNGTDQAPTSTQALGVGDATGSGTGWNITATSTTFSTGGGTPKTLSTSATTVATAPTDTCDVAPAATSRSPRSSASSWASRSRFPVRPAL